MELLIAISIGFVGSFHCIGMCGPIALAIPVHQYHFIKKTVLILSYNLGRITTYSAFGLLFGLIGNSIVVSGFQQVLSISVGILILFFLFLPSHIFTKSKLSNVVFQWFNKLKVKLSALFQKKGIRSLFSIGLLNGLLPCGLVYMGIAGALASGNLLKGAIFMALFGLGTLPAMLLVSYFGNLISINFRNNIKKVIPVFVGAMALLLILRGLDLDIPYVSPKMKGINSTCHSTKEIYTDYDHSKTIICTGQNSQHKR